MCLFPRKLLIWPFAHQIANPYIFNEHICNTLTRTHTHIILFAFWPKVPCSFHKLRASHQMFKLVRASGLDIGFRRWCTFVFLGCVLKLLPSLANWFELLVYALFTHSTLRFRCVCVCVFFNISFFVTIFCAENYGFFKRINLIRNVCLRKLQERYWIFFPTGNSIHNMLPLYIYVSLKVLQQNKMRKKRKKYGGKTRKICSHNRHNNSNCRRMQLWGVLKYH